MAQKQLTTQQLTAMRKAVEKARASFEAANEGKQYKTAVKDAAAVLPDPDSRNAENVSFCVTAALGLREATPNVVHYSKECVERWLIKGGTAPAKAHPWGKSMIPAKPAKAAKPKADAESAAEKVAEKAKAAAEKHAAEAESPDAA